MKGRGEVNERGAKAWRNEYDSKSGESELMWGSVLFFNGYRRIVYGVVVKPVSSGNCNKLS